MRISETEVISEQWVTTFVPLLENSNIWKGTTLMEKQTILIVEMDESVARVLKLILETRAYAVVTALNGLDGWQLAQELKPDLIILDIMLLGKG